MKKTLILMTAVLIVPFHLLAADSMPFFETLHCQKNERSDLGNIVIKYEIDAVFSSRNSGGAVFHLTQEGEARVETCQIASLAIEVNAANFALRGSAHCVDGSSGEMKLILNPSSMALNLGLELPYSCNWSGKAL